MNIESNAESPPKKLALDGMDKDSEVIEIKGSDGAEKVIEVMVSNKNNAHIQEQACDRLRSLSKDDGRPRYR